MRHVWFALTITSCLAAASGSFAQGSDETNGGSHGGSPGSPGGNAETNSKPGGDAASLKGKVTDPSLLKNGTGSGQSPEVPTGVATRPGTDNKKPVQ